MTTNSEHRPQDMVSPGWLGWARRHRRGGIAVLMAVCLATAGSLVGALWPCGSVGVAETEAGREAVALAQQFERVLARAERQLAAINGAILAGGAGQSAAGLSPSVRALRSERGGRVVLDAAISVDARGQLKQVAARGATSALVGADRLAVTTRTEGITSWALVDLAPQVVATGSPFVLLDSEGRPFGQDASRLSPSEMTRLARSLWTTAIGMGSEGREETIRAHARTAQGFIVEVERPATPVRPVPSSWLFMALAAAGLLAALVGWYVVRQEPVEAVLEEGALAHHELHRALAELVRTAANAVDLETVLEALERALNQGIPEAHWHVLSAEAIRSGAVGHSSLPADHLQVVLHEAETLTGQEPNAVTRALTPGPAGLRDCVYFVVRDVATVYGMAIADGLRSDPVLGERAEILLRTATIALRTVAVLRKLVASEQEAAVGRLVAGVAHEINNPLAFVATSLRALESQLEGELLEAVADALEGATRIDHLIRALRIMFRGTADSMITVVDVNAVAGQTVRVARSRKVGTPIQFQPGKSCWARCDEVGLGQALLDLLTNAVDAVHDRNDPQIELVVRQEDDQVCIEVRDNGRGVPRQLHERLFDAFVTSKGRRGMGLGLGIARAFARALEGDLALVSTGGKGSLFRLTLPAVAKNQRPASTLPPPLDERKPDSAEYVRPKVLIIDDEATLVRALKRWLGQSCTVTGTTSPQEGLDLAAKNEYDLILCDLNMPAMSGAEVAENLKQRCPAAAERLVIMTGSVEAHIPDLHVVNKPINPDVVARLLTPTNAGNGQRVSGNPGT